MLINTEKKQIELKYPTSADNGSIGFLSVARDRDIFGESGIFLPQAAKSAAALAISATDTALLRENLDALGYRDITLISYDSSSETKTGMALALNRYGDNVTVAVVLRPTTGREWYSNFDVGYGMEHSGFLKAAEFAEQRLGDYLFIRTPKAYPRFFVCGYSRGGAVANLLAKRLCDRYGLDAVRAYTFACPNTCKNVRAARWSSIFNLVREEDFFTRVPLTGWSYTRYGSTLSLSDCGDITKRYRYLTDREYIGFPSAEAVNTALGALIRLAPHVHAYYERRYEVGGYQLSLRDYMITVAEALADEADETTGDVLFSSTVSAFAQLTDFLSTGMDITALLTPAAGLPRCSVSDSHSTAAYIAALEEVLK